MNLDHGLHLAYCTNVHPGQTWDETLDSLERYVLEVKRRLGRPGPFAIGLRLSDGASRELAQPHRLTEFQRWLERNDCYVFTINGFPHGSFHGTRVKETVYQPDWTEQSRLEYTNRLFDLLAELLPRGVPGSVSSLPGSFKGFIQSPEQEKLIRQNIWRCLEHIAQVAERTGHQLGLALEPEPLCWLENSEETVRFFEQMRQEHPGDPRLKEHLGVNYDACHFAVEFEEPDAALAQLKEQEIPIIKLHISSALKLKADETGLRQLRGFAEDVYLHQVVVRKAGGGLVRFKDLGEAFAQAGSSVKLNEDEWRVHFHIPLHSHPPAPFESTADHVDGVLEILGKDPARCSHLEMETYTWAVLPESLRTRNVVDQIVAEYEWTLARLAAHGLGPHPAGRAMRSLPRRGEDTAPYPG
jgi:sugar phosphate isomerase/epimerase